MEPGKGSYRRGAGRQSRGRAQPPLPFPGRRRASRAADRARAALALSGRLRLLLGGAGGPGGGGLARGASVAFLLQGLGAGLAFAMQVLLGRWMGASDYGTYSFTVA